MLEICNSNCVMNMYCSSATQEKSLLPRTGSYVFAREKKVENLMPGYFK